jgi:pimeloyl-ACP methyl ester carboxylesterase
MSQSFLAALRVHFERVTSISPKPNGLQKNIFWSAFCTYFRPLVETPIKKAQVSQYAVSMETNLLVVIREQLHRWRGATRMVWGLKDTLFGVEWADWLDRTLPGSRGVRRVEGANLFFPEEMPDIIAEEALALWGISQPHPAAASGSRLL